jgi:hypothetical protein
MNPVRRNLTWDDFWNASFVKNLFHFKETFGQGDQISLGKKRPKCFPINFFVNMNT